jgi:hypothetical protein
MTRQIPTDKPLSDDDRAYLLMRGQEDRVDWFDQTYPDGETDDEEGDDYDSWKVDELKAEVVRLNEDEDAGITPDSNRKDDLIAALREYNARPEEG